ncbi:MAG TPA: PLP-dependent aminotransferase family protein [Chloroflexi bacterium]|jgi:2-aminoadipate transaminase|nr:PLP-dependent aminotransferase family protein [Chloroflexota bacterium]HPO58785.1 PLP-dependent aminotransferase family protein [Anaerolineaceae bacterium]
MINLTRGVPPVDVFPTEDLISAAERNMRADGKTVLQYVQAPGYRPLLEWLAQDNGVKPEEVFMGNSSLEIFAFLTTVLLKPGLRAFVESPSYDRANLLLQRSGAEVVPIPLEVDGVDLNAFEAELKRGAPTLFYIIADFQNPMGTTTSLAKRQKIAEWARQYNFWIVEDSPYRPLRYFGEDIPSLRELAPERVLQLSSFSKILAPGLRMGYVIGDAAVIKSVTKYANNTYIGPVTPTQGMVYEYLKAGLLPANLEKLRNLYRPRLKAMLDAIDRYLPGTTFPRPEGGFFIGVTLPEGTKMDVLLPRAAEAGLKLTDGRGFYINPAEGERFLRLPFCSLTPEEIEDAMKALQPVIYENLAVK